MPPTWLWFKAVYSQTTLLAVLFAVAGIFNFPALENISSDQLTSSSFMASIKTYFTAAAAYVGSLLIYISRVPAIFNQYDNRAQYVYLPDVDESRRDLRRDEWDAALRHKVFSRLMSLLLLLTFVVLLFVSVVASVDTLQSLVRSL